MKTLVKGRFVVFAARVFWPYKDSTIRRGCSLPAFQILGYIPDRFRS
jgi:hypothetical protein